MSVLFVEIGCEEIPARLQVKAVAEPVSYTHLRAHETN